MLSDSFFPEESNFFLIFVHDSLAFVVSNKQAQKRALYVLGIEQLSFQIVTLMDTIGINLIER